MNRSNLDLAAVPLGLPAAAGGSRLWVVQALLVLTVACSIPGGVVAAFGFGADRNAGPTLADIAKKYTGAKDGAIADPSGKRVYVAISGGNEIAVVDTASWKVVDRWPTGDEPDALGIVGPAAPAASGADAE